MQRTWWIRALLLLGMLLLSTVWAAAQDSATSTPPAPTPLPLTLTQAAIDQRAIEAEIEAMLRDKSITMDEYLNRLDQLVEQFPNTALIYLIRGNTYFDMDNLQRAINDYERAVSLDPTLFDAFFNRGTCYAKLGYSR